MASLKLIRLDANADFVPSLDTLQRISEQTVGSSVTSTANDDTDKYILTIYFDGDTANAQNICSYLQAVQLCIDSCDLRSRVVLMPIWKGLGVKTVELSAIASAKTHKFKYRKITKGESTDVRN